MNQLVSSLSSEQRAIELLNHFEQFTSYRHGPRNPFLGWLREVDFLTPETVVEFLNFWYPVSRSQPQLLLRCAAAFPDHADRRLLMQNYLEEDGMVNPGDNPHYDLLEELIRKLGGRLAADPVATDLVDRFQKSIGGMTPAQASGFLAGIEHPALDISEYFRESIRRCGFASLLEEDPYLTIHVHVEPNHIIWAHGNALRYLEDGSVDVIPDFRRVMEFWESFWPKAFSKLMTSA